MTMKRTISAIIALALAAGISAQAEYYPAQPETAYVQSAQFAGSASISSLKFGRIPTQICTGKPLKPNVTVKDGAKTLVLGKDYTVTYTNNKGVGTASAVIKGMGSYKGSKTLSFKIRPAAPVLEITQSDKTLTLSWNKVRGAGGYQLYYSVDGGEYKRLAATGKTSYSIIKPGARAGVFRFKVRAYKKVNGKAVCGSFSEVMIPGRASENSLADDGETFTILAMGSADIIADGFAEYTGGRVNVMYVDYPYEKADYLKAVSSADDVDVILVGADDVQELINTADVIAPLSKLGLEKGDFAQALPYTLAGGTAADGTFMAACVYPSPGAFVYRTDLAQQYLGVTSPEEMQELVKDWDAFAQTGERLGKASGGKTALVSSLYGGMFRAYIAEFGGSWVKDGVLDMKQVEGLLDFAEKMRAGGVDARCTVWTDEWFGAIPDGRALGEFVPSWGLLEYEYSVLLHQFSDGGKCSMAVCEGPAGWYWGGTYIAVPERCDNASLARQFIEYACINEQSVQQLNLVEGDFVNNVKAMSGIDRRNSLLGGQNEYPVLIESAQRLGECGSSVYDEAIAEAALTAVMRVLEDGFPRDSALGEFERALGGRFPELKFG